MEFLSNQRALYLSPIVNFLRSSSFGLFHFFILAIIPIFFLYLSLKMSKNSKNNFHTKLICLKCWLFILIAYFITLIAIVASKIGSSVDLFDPKIIFLIPKFTLGMFILIFFVTFIFRLLGKYTEFEHILMISYSVMSLWLFYFFTSQYKITYLSLVLLIFIFLINVSIYTEFIKYLTRLSDNYSRFQNFCENFFDCLELSSSLSYKIKNSKISFRTNFMAKQKDEFDNLKESFNSYQCNFYRFNHEFRFSFISFVYQGVKMSQDSPSEIYSLLENPLFQINFDICELKDNISIEIAGLIENNLINSVYVYRESYSKLLNADYSESELNRLFVPVLEVEEKVKKIKIFFENQISSHESRYSNSHLALHSFYSVLRAADCSFEGIIDIYSALNDIIKQMNYIWAHPKNDIRLINPKYDPLSLSKLLDNVSSFIDSNQRELLN